MLESERDAKGQVERSFAGSSKRPFSGSTKRLFSQGQPQGHAQGKAEVPSQNQHGVGERHLYGLADATIELSNRQRQDMEMDAKIGAMAEEMAKSREAGAALIIASGERKATSTDSTGVLELKALQGADVVLDVFLRSK